MVPSPANGAAGAATWIDTHAHLDAEAFRDDLDEVLGRATEAGLEAIVAVGIDASTSEAAVAIAERHDGVYAAVGIQPNSCHEVKSGDWERILALVESPQVVGLGETGLDRYWDFAPIELQREYFVRHLALAQETGLPVVIHCREAEPDVIAVLDVAARSGSFSGVLHAFAGDPQLLAVCERLGLFVSVAGPVSYTNKKFGPLREVAATIPDALLVVETDCPYLVPHPLRRKQKRNEPSLIVHTGEAVAALRETDVASLARRTTENARRLFRLDQSGGQ